MKISSIQESLPALAVVAIVIFWLAMIGGWIWNIVKITDASFASFDGMLIARCIGVFVAPLGAVLGFI